MSGRDRDKFRKYESGAKKAKKRKEREEFDRSQQGALKKFLLNSNRNNNQQFRERERQDAQQHDAGNYLSVEDSVMQPSEVCTVEHAVVPITAFDARCEIAYDSSDCSVAANCAPVSNIYDPAKWENTALTGLRDMIVEKGPVRFPSDYEYPRNEQNRRFSINFYNRKMLNGETMDRRWLVYSSSKDAAFCFSCKLFGKTAAGGQLANGGCSDWTHLGVKLQQHEVSQEHIKSMTSWLEAAQRLSRGNAVDKFLLEQIKKEKVHWRSVLTRILAVVQHLAQNNSAFRGKTEKLYESSNGNFLGLIEMLAKFDPIIQEHVRRIKDGEIHDHYLGHRIQNEFIELMATEVKQKIIQKAKLAKYFSVILDCTPDVSHQEQMSLILRFVDVSDSELKVMEHFLEFLPVEDTTGKGLSDILIATLKKLGLNIDDCRGQGYDNGANMKGKNQGVQAHIMRTNSRAFFTPCGCHSLNLVLGDMAKCSTHAISFFGVVQRVYTIFAASTERWKILKDNVSITAKPLSETRWECRVESVKALRYQLNDTREALLTVADETRDPKVRSEAESLANNDLGNFEFILAMVVWYDILFAVNTVSKTLQSADMQLDVAVQQVEGLVTYLKKYRDNGFSSALITAKEIACEMGVEQKFKDRRVRRKKKQFDYEAAEETRLSPEETFRTGFFLLIVDQALVSMEKRFEQLQNYSQLFGFLYDMQSLRKLNDEDLLKCCMNLDVSLRSGETRDLDGTDLCTEIKIFRDIIPDDIKTALKCLQYVWSVRDSFPNIAVALRIMMTVPVTVASAERSFSKLKLIKNYLRSTMSQDRLCGLAMLSIEKDTASFVDYDEVINEFAHRKARRVDFLL